MRRRTRARIALGVLSVALAGLTVAAWHGQQQASLEDHLLATAPASITRISLQLPGFPVWHFERHAQSWQKAGTSAHAANADQLRTLASIAAAPVERWIAADAVRPRELGLEPPRAILWLNGTKLVFGDLAPLNPQRYVLVPDGRVALISARYSPYLGAGIAAPTHHARTP